MLGQRVAGFWQKIVPTTPQGEQVYRAAAEAVLAATLLVFLFAYLNLNRWHVRYSHVTAGWLVFLTALIGLAVFDPVMAAGVARISIAAVAAVGFLLVVYLSTHHYDRAVMLTPTWFLLLAWVIATAFAVTGQLTNDFVSPALLGGLAATANQVRLSLVSDPANDRVIVQSELRDAEVGVGQSPTQWSVYNATDVAVPMPADIERIERRPPEFYLNNPKVSSKDQQDLRYTVVRLINYCKSEMHGRASFAVSCFVLVLVGASLGLMFKSGNFLSAFAVSVVPALVSIALIVTGQHTMEGVPNPVTAHNNPLHLGMALIWSGNAAVLIIGVTLLTKLQRR